MICERILHRYPRNLGYSTLDRVTVRSNPLFPLREVIAYTSGDAKVTASRFH